MKGRIFFVHVPNAAQSTVMLLQFGPKRTAPDYFAEHDDGAVFGGSFTSRLNMNLREDKGYSYGARGGFSYSRSSTARRVARPCGRLDVPDAARDRSRAQGLCVGRGAGDQGRARAREDRTRSSRLPGGSRPRRPRSASTAASCTTASHSTTSIRYVEKVTKVTEAQVKQSAAKHLKPDPAVYLVVGDGDAKMIIAQ